MIAASVGLVLPVAAVWLWMHLAGLRTVGDSRLVTAALAFGLGLGLSSVTTMTMVTAGVGFGPLFVALDATIWLGAAGI
ncbi:MAG: hypothetical protein FJW23_17585, partial [Acidimicrobiia bacterium]|nr:hypothetical protein [Acidimicrobiia bacterium]